MLEDGEIDQGIAKIGLRLGRNHQIGGRSARGLVEIGYERVFDDDGVSFAGAAFGQPIETVASGLGENRGRLGLAWEAEVSPHATVSVRYEGRFGDGQDHRLGLGLSLRF